MTNQDVLAAVVEKTWLSDGFDWPRVQLLGALRDMAKSDAATALRIIHMPFLEGFEAHDKDAMRFLAALHRQSPSNFQRVLSHQKLEEGITDFWAEVMALSGSLSVVLALLDARNPVEERVIDLPLAGETHLAIWGVQPSPAGSMNLLEFGVRHAEEFMGTPFPSNTIRLLFFEGYVPPGADLIYISSRPGYDGDLGAEIAHEVAHHYWRGYGSWIDEGATEVLSYVSENAPRRSASGGH